MAAAKPTTKVAKNKLGTIVTPVGSAVFVSAPRPSTFDENKIEASVVLTPEDFVVLKAEIDKRISELEEAPVVAIDKCKWPFADEMDKEGNPTGNIRVKAKTNVKYPPKFYAADGKQFVPGMDFQVANRSKIRLALGFEIVSTGMYKGVIARLNAIKIVSGSPWAGQDPFAGVDDEGDFTYTAGMSMGSPEGADDSDLDDEWN